MTGPAFVDLDWRSTQAPLPPAVELVAMAKAGMKHSEIAEQFGCSASTVSGRIRDSGLMDEPKVTTELHLVELKPDLTWQEQALCAQTDPEAFFPEKGGSTREAKKTCLSCEVRTECLDYALTNQERFGIWGGFSERERRKILRTKTPTAAPPSPLQPAPEEAPTMTTQEAPAPSYVDQIIAVMAASEGHPDPAVRAARKTVANALVALNKTLRSETPTTTPPAPLAVVPEIPKQAAGSRGTGSKRLGERVAALGVTPRDIRAWATERGLDVPSRGTIPERLVDAYEDAHQEHAS